MSAVVKVAGAPVRFVDDRITSSNWLRRNLRKIFPDHWSFMLGEIALYSFIILLLSGTFLTLWFKPSMTEVVYHGSYEPLVGIPMSEAYASTLDISFDVRGGLLMRQIHHWAALLFVAAMTVHMLRVFFTGAFRKPREMNWVIGSVLILVGLLEGFSGYSLPDDLLSGTGLRIAQGIILAIPVVGSYSSYFLFGGAFPGDDFISRIYTVHVLLFPGLILALVTAHLMMVWYQKHTQWPGPGRTNENVVGYPLFPVYTAKAGGFFFVVFGVIALMSAFIQINPVWLYGPYNPSQVSAGSQPDWYIGWLDGMLRVMPAWETELLGFTISWNVLVPSLVAPGIMTMLMIFYPWIEAFVTGDRREHHLLDRPRNQPTRTGLGVMALTFYTLVWVSGGNDFVAILFEIPVMTITWFMRVAVIALPPIMFVVTKRICIGLQRRDRDALLHGRESGVIKRLPHGEFVEVHEPLSNDATWHLAADDRQKPIEVGPLVDDNGVPAPSRRKDRLQARMSRWYFGDVVQKPTKDELAAQHHHVEAEAPTERDQLTGSPD
jgi:ubiquinol-cytochrome c reductase cytochrome b subunit